MLKKTKKKMAEYRTLAMLILLVVALVGVSVGKAVDDKKQAKTVIENQTVQGNYVVEGDAVVDNETLGLSIPSADTSQVTNFRANGVIQQCESDTSTLCVSTLSERKVWPLATSTVVFANARSATSSAYVTIDMSYGGLGVNSSSIMFTCGTSTNPYLAYSAATPPDAFFKQVVVPTSSQMIIDSRLAASSTPKGGKGLVLVGPSEYVKCIVQMPDLASLVCQSQGIQCEQVTSTGRVWQALATTHWSWIVSSTNRF